ncbi:4-alpha-glucanotransferase [Hutsoniella sourekii]
MKRASGVLLPIFSLPNSFGIGSFGQSAYQFVDFLVEAKQSYWQILPLTTTSYGDSPYQSFSAFAGNSHFIDLELLTQEGLLSSQDYEDLNFGSNPEAVDYGTVFKQRPALLQKAVDRFLEAGNTHSYQTFIQVHADWLEPFAEYMAIKEKFELAPWYEWEESIRLRKTEALAYYRQELADRLNYYRVTQFFFYQQWQTLKQYANDKGIKIIGDLPIYVARDSVEMWTSPHLFKVNEVNEPLTVAGCPPDDLGPLGQYWGNPIYDWQQMKEDGYQWWFWRLRESFHLYDIVRFDHFRGFESYWEIPYGSPDASFGKWVQGPGIAFFEAIQEKLGDIAIIAEDLGFITEEVVEMRQASGYPGMRVLQFGFSGKGNNPDLPHNYEQNAVAYVGTHDNMTALGWYTESSTQEERDYLDLYVNRRPGETIPDCLNRTIAASVADTAIYTMQDLLNLGNEAQMNRPGILGGNWQWRMSDQALRPDIVEKLRQWTEVYHRAPESNLSEEDSSF